MTDSILGIDIGKQKFSVALLIKNKTKSKSVKNSKEGFAALSDWLKNTAQKHVHACMEATGSYGDELALYLHDAGHTVSIVNPLASRASPRANSSALKMTRWTQA